MGYLEKFLIVVSVCSSCATTSPDSDSSRVLVPVQHRTEWSTAGWDSDFPGQADLAILLDVRDEPIIDVNTADAQGDSFLPRSWLETVYEAYEDTDVGDALQRENFYGQWRLVSARVTPCAPIGIRPDVDIDSWCWPAVRLVWQPVVSDFRQSWGIYTDFYADDRAIHAIYPVVPRGPDGSRIDGRWREVVAAHLADGLDPGLLSSRMREGFFTTRDSTAHALLSALHDLREPGLGAGAYSELDLRPEVQGGVEGTLGFRERLNSFLSEFAHWQDLQEMTSFSLPEGRNPAGSDIWVFVGFDGNSGFPRLKHLNVIGRKSGRELVDIGPSQTVAVGIEDTRVEDELESGNWELEESVIVDGEDIATIGPSMSDPYEFLVPNTSCASCHRLNGLRFDFHSLSGFEDRGITVSPRVKKDVARDLIWTRSYMAR